MISYDLILIVVLSKTEALAFDVAQHPYGYGWGPLRNFMFSGNDGSKNHSPHSIVKEQTCSVQSPCFCPLPKNRKYLGLIIVLSLI